MTIRGRIRRGRGRRNSLVLVLALAAIVVAAGVVLIVSLAGDVALSIPSESNVTAFAGRLMTVSGGVTRIYSTRGRVVKTISTPGADNIAVGERVAAIYGDSCVFIVSRRGDVTCEIESAGDIVDVTCGVSATAVVTRYGDSSTIRVFDPYGNEQSSVDQGELGGDRLMLLELSGSILCTTALDTDGALSAVSVRAFGIQGGGLSASATVYGDVTRDLLLSKNAIFAIGNERIMCYNHNGAKLSEIPCAGMETLFTGEWRNKPVIAMRRTDSSGMRLIVGEESRDLAFDAASATLVQHRLAILTTSGEVTLFDLTSGDADTLDIAGADALISCGRSLIVRIDSVWTRITL